MVERDMVEVVDARPPNFDAIHKVLPEASMAGVMFAYDGKVYYPGAKVKVLSRELNDHETVHLDRQKDYVGGPAAWWERYLVDAEFRYNEEMLAHAAEFKTYCKRHINPIKRALFLSKIATRLASPLYAAGVTAERAAQDIMREAGV